MCPESLHVYRRMGTREHERLINLASSMNVDAIQSGNVVRMMNDEHYSSLLADFDLKTAGLLDHFSSLPDLYEVLSLEAASKSWLPSIMVGGAAASAGEYAVKHAVTTIE